MFIPQLPLNVHAIDVATLVVDLNDHTACCWQINYEASVDSILSRTSWKDENGVFDTTGQTYLPVGLLQIKFLPSRSDGLYGQASTVHIPCRQSLCVQSRRLHCT